MFPQFDSLPDNLRLPVIQKLNSYSYIRYRRANRAANDFCSKYTNFIKIRLRKNARLYLLDNYTDLIAFGSLENANASVKGIQVMVDYGTRRSDANLALTMTLENIEILHKAIQGFYFDEIVVWNCKHYMTPEEDRVFHEALAFFLSAIRHLRCPWVTVRNLNRIGLETLATKLRPKSLTLSKIELTEADLRLAEKMTYEIYFDFAEKPRKSLDFVKICKNKKIVSMQNMDNIFPGVFWDIFESLLKCWKVDSIPLQDGLLIFGENGHFMDEDLSLPKSRFSRLGAFHLGSYHAISAELLFQRRERPPVPLKYDYFLLKCPEKWIVFYLRRSKSDDITAIRMGFTNLARKGHQPEEYLAKILRHLFFKSAVDFSSVRERLEAEATLEGKRKYLSEFVSHIVSFYTPPPPAVNLDVVEL